MKYLILGPLRFDIHLKSPLRNFSNKKSHFFPLKGTIYIIHELENIEI